MFRTIIEKHLKGDPIIWFIVILLSVLSIFVVYSATGTLAYRHMGGNTEYYLLKHTLLVMLSLMAMWIAHKIRVYPDYSYGFQCPYCSLHGNSV